MPTVQTSPTSFSRELWQAHLALYEKTLALPFNRELAAGKLSRERFRHYIIQDAHYLLVYGRALAAAAAKADHADDVVQFAEAARTAVVVERSLHDGFMRDYGITAQDFAATPLSPACHHYTQFLLATAWSAPYPVVLASLLPCYRIYAEVGLAIHASARHPNPYEAWIQTYSSEEFLDAVQAVCDTLDRVADATDPGTRARMHAAYTTGAQLEWMFWDSAYRLERWPV